MNHHCLALLREETRQVVLTCLAGGFFVPQSCTAFGLLTSCPSGRCAHVSLYGSITQDLSNGQAAPRAFHWVSSGLERILKSLADSQEVPKAFRDLFIWSAYTGLRSKRRIEWGAQKEEQCPC